MSVSKVLKSRGGLLAIAVAALAVATPALAELPYGPDVSVRYSDLDLESVDGATALLKRIESAADSVCAPLNHGDMASLGVIRRCHRSVTAKAVAKMNHPVLAAIYKSSHPSAPPVAALAR